MSIASGISRNGCWLARLSDPAGLNGKYSARPYGPHETAEIEKLLALAGAHNVRAAFTRNLKKQLRSAPDEFLRPRQGGSGQMAEQIIGKAEEAQLLEFVRNTLLNDAAREVMERVATQGLPAVVVKGPDFAQAAYGGLEWRNFSDIDILIAPEAADAVHVIMSECDFRLVQPQGKRIDYGERAYLRKSHGGNLLVEIHTDIVHAPELRRAQRLDYQLYASPACGGVSNASRLVLAGLHGATSHLFGRLQYVVDGLMVARSGVDGAELRERAERSGATRAVATMLRLAGDIYGSEVIPQLIEALGPVKWQSLERVLIAPNTVLSAKDEDRWQRLPQRYLYRFLLRHQESLRQ